MHVTREFVAPTGIAAAAIFLLYITTGFRSPYAQSEIFGPASFPRVVLIGLIAVSFIQLLRLVMRSRTEPPHPEPSAQFDWLRFTAALAALIGYIILMRFTGFLPATLTFQVAILVVVFGWRDLRMVLGVPAGLTFLYFIIFVRLLDLPLPQGYGWFRQLSRALYF